MHESLSKSSGALRTNGHDTWGYRPSTIQVQATGSGAVIRWNKPSGSEEIARVAKPKIYLKHAWSDSGWRYEQWFCHLPHTYMIIGMGGSPVAAYDDWLLQELRA